MTTRFQALRALYVKPTLATTVSAVNVIDGSDEKNFRKINDYTKTNENVKI